MHPIKRFFLIGLFGLGTIGGFAHGFAHMGHCHAARRDAFETHVADLCTESAQRVFDERRAEAAPAPVAGPTTTITIAAPATLTVGSAVPAATPVTAIAPPAAPVDVSAP